MAQAPHEAGQRERIDERCGEQVESVAARDLEEGEPVLEGRVFERPAVDERQSLLDRQGREGGAGDPRHEQAGAVGPGGAAIDQPVDSGGLEGVEGGAVQEPVGEDERQRARPEQRHGGALQAPGPISSNHDGR